MQSNIMKSRKKIILIISLIIIIITVICGSLFGIVKQQYQKNTRMLEEEMVNKYNEEYQTILYGYRKLAYAYYSELVSNEQIMQIMKQANAADEKDRNQLRKELYDLSIDKYTRAMNNNFRQYHFVLHDNTSFLRMHKPENYGDNLRDYRESVRIANEEGQYVEGFEEGRVYNGYRFEFPLSYQGQSIGCVEISLSYALIANLMDELFNTKSLFLINRSLVDEKVFDEFVGLNYETVAFSNDYYVDSETMDQVQHNKKHDMLNFLHEKTLDKDHEPLLLKQQTFFVPMTYEDREYGVIFINIDNIKGDHAGYLVFIDDWTHFYHYEASVHLYSSMIALMWLMMTSIVLILFFSRIRMESITYHDQLTGVYNRNKLYDIIYREMQRDKRYETSLSLILFDVDEFKQVNDIYGHTMGDKVLKNISQTVQDNLRINDALFRYGGDEFLVLLPNTNLEEATQVAEKNSLLIRNITWEGIDKPVTLSMGVVQYNRKESIEHLINRSDNMLYKAKQQGRNCVFADNK